MLLILPEDWALQRTQPKLRCSKSLGVLHPKHYVRKVYYPLFIRIGAPPWDPRAWRGARECKRQERRRYLAQEAQPQT